MFRKKITGRTISNESMGGKFGNVSARKKQHQTSVQRSLRLAPCLFYRSSWVIGAQMLTVPEFQDIHSCHIWEDQILFKRFTVALMMMMMVVIAMQVVACH